MSEVSRLGAEKTVRLTTFRRNGQPVVTPVWVAPDGEALLMFSERTAGKVKRLRHDDRVELVGCDFRGGKLHGAAVTGRARILDEAGSERARRALARKYGILGRLTMLGSRLRGGKQRTVGLEVLLVDR